MWYSPFDEDLLLRARQPMAISSPCSVVLSGDHHLHAFRVDRREDTIYAIQLIAMNVNYKVDTQVINKDNHMAPAGCRTHDTQVMTKLHTFTSQNMGYTKSQTFPAKTS